MGTPLGHKCIPYTYMDPLGTRNSDFYRGSREGTVDNAERRRQVSNDTSKFHAEMRYIPKVNSLAESLHPPPYMGISSGLSRDVFGMSNG